jgi:ribosome recycling factor
MDTYLKELDEHFKGVIQKLREDMRGLRSNRPSLEFLENLKVNYFDTWMTVKQLGSLSFMPPREVRITVWDKGAAAPIAKAIEEAQAGFSVTNEGTLIRATLSALSSERREELGRMIKKTVEGTRIEVRNLREDTVKRMKTLEDKKEITEDDMFSAKEKIQKRVNEANAEIEKMLEEKLVELAE